MRGRGDRSAHHGRARRSGSIAIPTTSPAANSNASRSRGRSSATRRLLLADEPTGSLDTASSDEVIELLATLPRERGTAIVLVTHEPRFASWADRVLFLRDGRIVDETGTAPTPPAATVDVGERPMTVAVEDPLARRCSNHRRVPRRVRTAGQWRFAARLARREVRRRPGRTLLVMLLVAVPVLGMTAITVLVRTERRHARRSVGARRSVRPISRPATGCARRSAAASAAALPPGSRSIRLRLASSIGLSQADGTARLADVTDATLADPMLRGVVLLHVPGASRAPRARRSSRRASRRRSTLASATRSGCSAPGVDRADRGDRRAGHRLEPGLHGRARQRD